MSGQFTSRQMRTFLLSVVSVLLLLLAGSQAAANQAGYLLVGFANSHSTAIPYGSAEFRVGRQTNGSKELNSNPPVFNDFHTIQSSQPSILNTSRCIWIIPQRKYYPPYIVSAPCPYQMNIQCCPLDGVCPSGLPPCPQSSPPPPCCPPNGACRPGLPPCPGQFPTLQCCPMAGSCPPGLPPCSRR